MSTNDGGEPVVERRASGAESTHDVRATRVRVRTLNGDEVISTFDARPAGPSAVHVPSVTRAIAPPLD